MLAAGCQPSADRAAGPDAARPESLSATEESPPASPMVLSGAGVGCVRIGDAVATLRASCDVVSDTTVPGPEGMTQRVLVVRVGAGTLPVTVADDSIYRAVVTDPAIRTADSLGVGSELDDLLARPGATAIEGEGRLFVTLPSHCGLSFRLAALRDGRAGSTDELVRTVLPRNTAVDEVLVIGCRG